MPPSPLPQSAPSAGEQMARLQHFAATVERMPVAPDRAQRTLEEFWGQVVQTAAGCWLWHGKQPKAIIYHGVGYAPSTHRIEPHHLAWVLGTGHLPPDDRSTLLPTCPSPGCLNPAHTLEVVTLWQVWWRWRPKEEVGEDDWHEIIYRFSLEVEQGTLPSMQVQDKTAVRRDVFDAWMHSEGRLLMDAFTRKYHAGRSRAVSRAKKAPQTATAPGCGRRGSQWWQPFGLTVDEVHTQVARFQRLAAALSETALDQDTALRNLERFYSRIALRPGGCWAWNWQEPQFRLFRNGPWVSPRDLAWWLTTGTSFGGSAGVYVASHNGRSWCMNPAHSDVEFNTINAALFLVRVQGASTAEAPEQLHPLDAPVQAMRHRLHQAVEQGSLAYRLLEPSRTIELWRSDVVAWWQSQPPDSA